MKARKVVLFHLSAIMVVATLVGCGGGGTATVTGTVTLDGAPVDGAGVVFTPEGGGRAVNATTDASGKFTLEAMLGPNVVAVTKTRPLGGAAEPQNLEEGASPADMGENAKLEYLVPKKYRLASTSGLKVTVEKGMEPPELKLVSK